MLQIYLRQLQRPVTDTVLMCNQNPNEQEAHLKKTDLNGPD